MSNPRIRRGAGFAALALAAGTLLGVPAADAQFARASLAGTVTDGSGLALPGVTVTATNADTGAARVVTTSGNGRYILNGLIPVRYNLSFELSAFRPVRQDVLQLLVGQEASLNVTLELGGIEETVVVTAEAPVVDVTSKEVGATVTTETMESLPTQSRSFIDFATATRTLPAAPISTARSMGWRSPTLPSSTSASVTRCLSATVSRPRCSPTSSTSRTARTSTRWEATSSPRAVS